MNLILLLCYKKTSKTMELKLETIEIPNLGMKSIKNYYILKNGRAFVSVYGDSPEEVELNSNMILSIPLKDNRISELEKENQELKRELARYEIHDLKRK